uniref:Vitrin n=1 Tax=Varanus komodoensis TaxID=61221 RepID=A0A8D2JHP4_VARKO
MPGIAPRMPENSQVHTSSILYRMLLPSVCFFILQTSSYFPAYFVSALLLAGTSATKEATKKNKKPKLLMLDFVFTDVPQIECDVKAAKIINPEFIAMCPSGCQDVKYRVYGTDIYASFSSICGAAIHSGTIDRSGGKILVQKVAGQSGYKGSFTNGIRSLSLPRWRESFIVSDKEGQRSSILFSPDCKVDLAFLIDGSWSIGKRRFQIQKQFLRDVAQALDVGTAGPLMGMVQYGDDPFVEFNLKSHTNSKNLKNAIEKIVQKGGLSNVGRALSFVNKIFFEDSNGNRGSAPNVAVVMVDGWPTDRVEEASRLARESGINIFFLTIEGPDENEKQNVIEANFVDKAVCRTNGYYSINVPSWFSLHKVVQPLVKRVCDSDRLACSKTCLNAADIGFVIDGSSSVGTGNFRTILQFVANISKEFEISDTDTRIGAVQYTYEQRLEFGFDKHNTKQDVLNAIKRINYWSGGTSTGAAINYAFEQLFSKSKPNKRKLMILITDGRSYDDVRGAATAAHQNGVIAYSIGIAWAAQDELETIATDPDKEHSFFVDEFDHLYRFVPRIIQNICTEFNSQPRN